jgi:hypothetical protein
MTTPRPTNHRPLELLRSWIADAKASDVPALRQYATQMRAVGGRAG